MKIKVQKGETPVVKVRESVGSSVHMKKLGLLIYLNKYKE